MGKKHHANEIEGMDNHELYGSSQSVPDKPAKSFSPTKKEAEVLSSPLPQSTKKIANDYTGSDYS